MLQDKPFYRNKLVPEGSWIEKKDAKTHISGLFDQCHLEPLNVKKSHGEYVFLEEEAKSKIKKILKVRITPILNQTSFNDPE